MSTVLEEKQEAKFRKVIQPVDENGNPIGQANVFEADTQEELLDKIANANAHATRKINQLNRQIKLGEKHETERETPEIKGRDLTDDERFELSTQLTDPKRAKDAAEKIAATVVGKSPKEIQEENKRLKSEAAVASVNAFKRLHPEYVGTPQDVQNMSKAMKNLPWTVENLETVFEELKEAGLLQLAPAQQTESETPTGRIISEEVNTPAKRTAPSTGIEPRWSSSPKSDAGKKKEPTAEQIKKMSPDEYKAYAKKVGLLKK